MAAPSPVAAPAPLPPSQPVQDAVPMPGVVQPSETVPQVVSPTPQVTSPQAVKAAHNLALGLAKSPPPKPDLNSLPTRQYLEQTVVPTLTQGMHQLVRERPSDPIEDCPPAKDVPSSCEAHRMASARWFTT
ncbi:hypothetical protein WJX74_009786 [Apatococcus lobatus]|uniref:Uncharacterized protein n=1 Tax=Apatococcus lobatus TaxID=904363 RepID=A0AAW1RJB5_9CHLO